jgi:hypothetical protein
MPRDHESTSFRVPADIHAQQEEYLTSKIAVLWEKSDLRTICTAPLFQYAHQTLRELIAAGKPELLVPWYAQRILEVSGYDEIWLSEGTDLGAHRIAAPPSGADDRRLYYVLVTRILDGAGLYNPQYPDENRHYRLLVAHLLIWPEEILDASQLVPPFPYSWFIQEEQRRRPSFQPEQDITAQQERLVNTFNCIVRSASGKRKRATYRSVAKRITDKEPPAVLKPARKMSRNHKKVAQCALDLFEEDTTRTLQDVIDNEETFQRLQKELWHVVRINAVSTLYELLSRYEEQTGKKRPPREKDRPRY